MAAQINSKRKQAKEGKKNAVILNLNAKMGATLALSHFVKLLFKRFLLMFFFICFEI